MTQFKETVEQIKRAVRRHRTLMENFGYLSVLQFFAMLLPLLTIPHLMRVLGAEQYGLVVYAQAIIQYFVVVVNFGFNISGTKEISLVRGNEEQMREVVSSILIIKALLFFLSFLVLSVIVHFVSGLREYRLLFHLTMLACLGEVIFPLWFFQGIEKMRYIAVIHAVSRSIFVIFIFVFIKQPTQYLLVPVFNGIGVLMAGFMALWIVFRKEKIRFFFPRVERLWYYVKDSAPLFLTRVSAQVYVRTNIVVVGAALGMAEVAYYDNALKVVTALGMPFQALKTAIFPKVSKDLDLRFVHKVIKIVIAVALLAIAIVQVLSPLLVQVLMGEAPAEAVWVLRLLSVNLLAVVISGFFGEQLLLPFGRKKLYVQGVMNTALFYFMLLFLLYGLKLLNLYSVVLAVVTTEFFLAVYFMIACRKNKLF